MSSGRQPTPLNAPDGFSIFRFDAEACEITVTYAHNAAENGYHVALHDETSGICRQAVVDDNGRIILTGETAETEPGIGNAGAIPCEAQGYTYEIRSDEDGDQCGACVFPDGSACKGWSFFHGECASHQLSIIKATIKSRQPNPSGKNRREKPWLRTTSLFD